MLITAAGGEVSRKERVWRFDEAWECGGRAGGGYDAEERTHDEKAEDRDIPSAASLTVAAREKQKLALETRRN